MPQNIKPVFAKLWEGYPQENHPCHDGNDKGEGTDRWPNQCAIRMSIALNAEGTILVNKDTYTEPKCSHGHARGAESLANWLWREHLRRPKIYSDAGKAKVELMTKRGIIFFKDCFTRSDGTQGDHMDLWDSGTVKTYDDPANSSQQVWFWELQ